MKNTLIGGVLAASIALLPTGFALAKDGPENTEHGVAGVSVGTSIQLTSEIHGSSGRERAEDNSVRSSTTASSTHQGGYWSNPDNAEDVKDGRGDESREHATSTIATTSHGRNDDIGDDLGNAHSNGISSFLSWFFGHPASTTVGDIRAQIQASTSASTTISTHNDEGLGLFARIFNFFHIGRGDN